MTQISSSNNPFHQIPPEVLENYLKGYISSFIREELERFVLTNEQRAKELSLMERVIKVEEELKSLREIESARFEAMEKRFEAMEKRFEAMEKRFEAMDKRFESLQREMNARFEAIDKRFEAMDKRFTFLQWFVGIGFSAVLGLTSLMPLWLKLFH
jgi:chaperonin cofactor prefoldin